MSDDDQIDDKRVGLASFLRSKKDWTNEETILNQFFELAHIAQELLERYQSLGGIIDDEFSKRIGGRLDLEAWKRRR